MPVLVNSETGLAEDIPQEQAQSLAASGQYKVPLIDPQGQHVDATEQDASQLLAQGYRQPNTNELQNRLDYTKYSSAGEQAKSFLEGAASGATLGLSTGVETALGIATPEDITARREVNPGVHALGQGAGLAGTALIPGVGTANALTMAGEAGAAALGLGAAEALLPRIGSAAAKGIIENAIFQSGDEISKMFANDPHQSLETAAANIGLSGVIGGGFNAVGTGAVSPLWQATKESSLGKFLGAVKDKANGVGKGALSPEISEGIDQLGLNLSPVAKAGISADPELRSAFQYLQESNTHAGKKAQEALFEAKKQTNDALLTSLGKTKESIEHLGNMSEAQVGDKLKNTVSKEIKEKIGPLSEQFEKIKEKFKNTAIGDEVKAGINNEISTLAESNNYHLATAKEKGSLVNDVMKDIGQIKDLEGLRNLQSNLQDKVANPELRQVANGLKNILRDAEENVVERELSVTAPELIGEHKAARAAYKQNAEFIDALNDRLHVGRYKGPGSFVKSLAENLTPEVLLNRLGKKGDAELLNLVETQLPETSKLLKEYHLDSVIEKAMSKAKGSDTLNANTLLKEIDNWSPELKKYVLPEGSEGKIETIKELLKNIPEKMNPSGTAKTLDKLWDHMPGGLGGVLSAISGHNPISGYVMGHVGKLVSKEVPDAIKYSMLKFMGSDAPISGSAFKAMVDFADNVIKGEAKVTKATDAIFDASKKAIPSFMSDKDRERLKKRLDELDNDHAKLLDAGGHNTYYMPEQGYAMGEYTMRALDYLRGLKPDTGSALPLDKPLQPNKSQQYAYNRALDIANNPLVVLGAIKQGNLTSKDVDAMRTMYPALYKQTSQKIMNQIIASKDAGKSIPYNTRLNLSMYLGQNLDSSMTPQSIAAAQPKGPQQAQPQQQPQSKVPQSSFKKMSSMEMLPNQARVAQKAKQSS